MNTYRVSFVVECAPQDDLEHFGPDTVTAKLPGTNVAAVGGNDAEAVRMLARFMFQGFYGASAPDIMRAVTVERVE